MSKRSIVITFSKFIIGGSAYGLIEILWRGFTHFTMVILGGLCFLGLLHISKYKLGILPKSVVGCGMITAAELAAGILLNIWLGLAIWDYTDMRFHLWGQISLRYFALWCGLSLVVFIGCQIFQILWKPKEGTSTT